MASEMSSVTRLVGSPSTAHARNTSLPGVRPKRSTNPLPFSGIYVSKRGNGPSGPRGERRGRRVVDRGLEARRGHRASTTDAHFCCAKLRDVRRMPFLSPPCEGGARGGGDAASDIVNGRPGHRERVSHPSHGRREARQKVSLKTLYMCLIMPGTTTPPGPPFTRGGKKTRRSPSVKQCDKTGRKTRVV